MLIYSGVIPVPRRSAGAVSGSRLFAFIYQCIVLAEEDFLRQKFGDAYRAYCRECRAGGSAQPVPKSTEGMSFNVRRVIAKDYSTMSAALITLLVINSTALSSMTACRRACLISRSWPDCWHWSE